MQGESPVRGGVKGSLFGGLETSLKWLALRLWDWLGARQECINMFLASQHFNSLGPFPQAGFALYEILGSKLFIFFFLPTQGTELSTSLSRNKNLTR